MGGVCIIITYMCNTLLCYAEGNCLPLKVLTFVYQTIKLSDRVLFTCIYVFGKW